MVEEGSPSILTRRSWILLAAAGFASRSGAYTIEEIHFVKMGRTWYAGAMVPLALANVLVNDLLARSRFRVVPAMVVLAVAYGFTLPFMLNHFPGRLEVALQTLGAFNLLLLAICAWFTFRGRSAAVQAE